MRCQPTLLLAAVTLAVGMAMAAESYERLNINQRGKRLSRVGHPYCLYTNQEEGDGLLANSMIDLDPTKKGCEHSKTCSWYRCLNETDGKPQRCVVWAWKSEDGVPKDPEHQINFGCAHTQYLPEEAKWMPGNGKPVTAVCYDEWHMTAKRSIVVCACNWDQCNKNEQVLEWIGNRLTMPAQLDETRLKALKASREAADIVSTTPSGEPFILDSSNPYVKVTIVAFTFVCLLVIFTLLVLVTMFYKGGRVKQRVPSEIDETDWASRTDDDNQSVETMISQKSTKTMGAIEEPPPTWDPNQQQFTTQQNYGEMMMGDEEAMLQQMTTVKRGGDDGFGDEYNNNQAVGNNQNVYFNEHARKKDERRQRLREHKERKQARKRAKSAKKKGKGSPIDNDADNASVSAEDAHDATPAMQYTKQKPSRRILASKGAGDKPQQMFSTPQGGGGNRPAPAVFSQQQQQQSIVGGVVSYDPGAAAATTTTTTEQRAIKGQKSRVSNLSDYSFSPDQATSLKARVPPVRV